MTIVIFVLIAIAALFLLFRFLRIGSGRMSARSSERSWVNLALDSDFDTDLSRIFEAQNVAKVIREVLIPNGINYIKFHSNLTFLTSLYTPSIQHFSSPHKRPVNLARWFLAAFPDVIAWTNEGSSERSTALYEKIPEEVLNQAMDKGADSEDMIAVYSEMIKVYRRKVSPNLEVQ